MRHLTKVSVAPKRATRVSLDELETGVLRADAKSDFMNAIYVAWEDYVYAKKNEMRL